MKKILLGIAILLMAVSVNASTGDKVTNIKIEDIKITMEENIGYSETLEIKYSINPTDASNTNLVWSISGLKTGITANFVNGNETSQSTGVLAIEINNTLDKEVTLKLIAKQNEKTVNTTNLKVETKESTVKRVTGEVEELILDLDEKFNKENYEDNKEILDTIESELEKNEEIEELIDQDLLTRYNDAKDAMNTYEENQNKTFTIVISIVLVAIFVVGMFLIFKKEEK